MAKAGRFRFTEARIEAARQAAKPAAADAYGRVYFYDEGEKGLVLVVNTRTRAASFYFQARIDGRTTRRALGDVETVSLVEAREAVKDLRYKGTTAAVFAPRPDADKQAPKLGAVLDDMLAAHATGSWLPGRRRRRGPPTDRTMRFYKDLRVATTKAHESKTLAEFAAALPSIYAKLSKKAPIQANRALQLWRNVFSYATAAGLWRGVNPAADDSGTARLTKSPERPRQRILTEAEWTRLEKAMAKDNPLWRDLFSFSIATAQRMGACCRARWSDITLTGKDAAWRIPARDMKGRAGGHSIPLAVMPSVVAMLKARRKLVPADCPWVFPAIDSEGHAVNSYKSAWKRLLEAAKLDSEDREQRPRPHDLRRTAGSRMVSAGTPLNVVTKALGDAPSSVSMVSQTYAVVVDNAMAAAFAATEKSRRR